jgi:hypothetical protein
MALHIDNSLALADLAAPTLDGRLILSAAVALTKYSSSDAGCWASSSSSM